MNPYVVISDKAIVLFSSIVPWKDCADYVLIFTEDVFLELLEAFRRYDCCTLSRIDKPVVDDRARDHVKEGLTTCKLAHKLHPESPLSDVSFNTHLPSITKPHQAYRNHPNTSN